MAVNSRLTRRNARHNGRLMLAVIGVAAVLAGCASSGGDPVSTDSGDGIVKAGVVNQQSDAGPAVGGGQITVGVMALMPSLDPTKTSARGSTGGTEMAAIFDVLMQYDTETDEYKPRLAKSLEASGDGLSWTMKIRDGVTFSDGSPYDAAAVVASIDRYNAGRGNGAALWLQSVDRSEVVDPQTVVFHLNDPWPSFPSMLAFGHGMIVAPAAQQGETFTPIGAGPFVQERFAPNEERILKARDDYWDGAPNLDGLRFVALNGPQENVESLNSGGIDVAVVRGNSKSIEDVQNAGYPGFMTVLNSGAAELINNRDGHPGADVRVRQAIAHALDTALIDERAESGQGLPGTAFFGPTSRWHGDVAGVAYDPDKARELLAAAKADGYDGKLNYRFLQEPKDRAIGLAVQSLLQAVGFEVTNMPATDVSAMIADVYVKNDFDLAHAGIGLYDSIPVLGMEPTFNSKSTGNFAGYANPEMDALLLDLQQAKDADATRAVLDQIQALANETVPSVPISAMPELVVWQKHIHGIVPNATAIMMYDKAWKSAE